MPPNDHETPALSWKNIAEKASTEKDPKKLLELTELLTRVMNEEQKERKSKKSA